MHECYPISSFNDVKTGDKVLINTSAKHNVVGTVIGYRETDRRILVEFDTDTDKKQRFAYSFHQLKKIVELETNIIKTEDKRMAKMNVYRVVQTVTMKNGEVEVTEKLISAPDEIVAILKMKPMDNVAKDNEDFTSVKAYLLDIVVKSRD